MTKTKWSVNVRDREIAFLACEIKERINGGSLYGETIDMDNIDEVIVATYLLASIERMRLFATTRLFKERE